MRAVYVLLALIIVLAIVALVLFALPAQLTQGS